MKIVDRLSSKSSRNLKEDESKVLHSSLVLLNSSRVGISFSELVVGSILCEWSSLISLLSAHM